MGDVQERLAEEDTVMWSGGLVSSRVGVRLI